MELARARARAAAFVVAVVVVVVVVASLWAEESKSRAAQGEPI